MIDPRLRLREAVIEGNVSIVKRLLRRYPQYLKNINPSNGWSSLHYAGYYGHYILCVHLVTLGHDSDEISLNFEGNSPVHTTVLSGNHQTLLMILQNFPNCLNLKGYKLRSPLHMASIMNYSNCVETLIEKGANINPIDIQGNTPLHLAMMYGNKEVVKVLLIHNADLDIRNAEGWLPIEVGKDVKIENWFNELKQDLLKEKSKHMSIITSNSSSASNNLFSYNKQQQANSPISVLSTNNQPAFQKINRTNSDIDLSTEFISPKKNLKNNYYSSSPKSRKHSNSSPGVLNYNDTSLVMADTSIEEEEPSTPTYSKSFAAAISDNNNNNNTELFSMSSPLFPPSIPPTEMVSSPSSSIKTGSLNSTPTGGNSALSGGSPLKPIEFQPKRNKKRSASTSDSFNSEISEDNELYFQPRKPKAPEITSPILPAIVNRQQQQQQQQHRIHSNSVGAQTLSINNNLDTIKIFSPVLREVKSSSSLTQSNNTKSSQNLMINNRSRAGSVHHMINTPGRYRSNTILSYNSVTSDGKPKHTPITTPKPFYNQSSNNLQPGQTITGLGNSSAITGIGIIKNNNDNMKKIDRTKFSLNDDFSSSSISLNSNDNNIYEEDNDSGTDVDSNKQDESESEGEDYEPHDEIQELNTNKSFDNSNQLNFNLNKTVRNTPSHIELAKFYSPQPNDLSIDAFNYSTINRSHKPQPLSLKQNTPVVKELLTPQDGVNPFVDAGPSQLIAKHFEKNGSNSSLNENLELSLNTNESKSKRSSILAVPIMSSRRRAETD